MLFRSRVTHDGAGRAARVVVDAAVIGQVASVDAAGGSLVVAGQRVEINLDSAQGPITVFGGGYSGLADIAVGDLAEVHGSPVRSAGGLAVRASRLEKEAPGTPFKVSGVATSVVSSPSTHTFALGALTVDFTAALAAGRVLPSAARLVDGATVRVFAASTALTGSTLTASAIRIGSDREEAPVNTAMQLGGVVSSFDSVSRSFSVDGLTVRLGSAAVLPSGASVADQSWVRVEGVLASDGSVDASRIEVRQSSTASDLARVKLVGPISDLSSQNAFLVRGVPVDASAVMTRTGCPAVLVDGVVVEVVAQIQAGSEVVSASALSCPVPPPPSRLVRPEGGRITAVDAASQTITVLNPEGESRQIRWTSSTAFVGPGLSAATSLAAGQAIQAEGIRDGEVLVAKVIALFDARAADRFRKPPPGSSQPTRPADSWNSYSSTHR